MLVDVHAHITHKDVDVKKILRGIRQKNVKKVITNGLHPEDNKKVLELSQQHKEIQAALGLYPRNRQEKAMFFKQLQKESYVAIGEIGLDYKKDDTQQERQEQKEVFTKIIKKARHLKKPVLIHSRGAEKHVLSILKEQHAYNPILHCFTGNKKQWRQAIQNGYYLSIPTNITRSQQFKQIVNDTPLHQLLTESDTPYLSPTKEYPNTPANVHETVKIIANIKGLTYQDTAYNIFMNYQRLF